MTAWLATIAAKEATTNTGQKRTSTKWQKHHCIHIENILQDIVVSSTILLYLLLELDFLHASDQSANRLCYSTDGI